jgi:cell fate (sporulation/competence/biofilm development) regulator YmcA (YheA/YmcA/DUF963 family)
VSRQQSLRDEEQPAYVPQYVPQPHPMTVRANDDIVQIEVSIPTSSGYDRKTELVKIHKSRDMSDLYSRVRRVIREDGRWTDDVKDIKLLYKNSIVSETISLKQAGLDKDAKVTVVYERNEAPPIEVYSVPIKPLVEINELAPKKPKAGYSTIPSYSDLRSLPTAQL